MADPKPPLPKRFYENASARPEGDGFLLALDGRPARTPGRHPLAVPTRALGDAVAAEWMAQGETIDPATMPFTRLANTAIDGVAREMDAVRSEMVRYAGSDLVAYRAGGPDRLVAAQAAAWDPIVGWARAALGAYVVLTEGVVFAEQPAESLERIAAVIATETSPFRLAALHVLTTLSGSVLLALMLAAGKLPAQQAWLAAHVDELYQESVWGQDLEAGERRAAREADFMAAARMLALVEPPASGIPRGSKARL